MTALSRRAVFSGAAAALVAQPASIPGGRLLTYPSGGRPVLMQVAQAFGRGQRPAVVLAHGRSGLAFYRSRLDELSTALVARGLSVLIPHYMSVTGEGDQPPLTDANLDAWTRALDDGVRFAAGLPGVARGRIGYAGFSLGANLGGVIAARGAPIAALASNYAGLTRRFPADAGRMPPTLMIQARGDPLIGLVEVERYRDRLRRLGARPDLVVFDSDQHVLAGADWTRSVRLMTDFFVRELRPGGAA